MTHRFGAHTAVADLSLVVPPASITGFIGPNGSGKTTTMRAIMRIIEPSEGVVRVLGKTAGRAANDRIGYLPEERGIYRQMRVVDLLRFYARLKNHEPTSNEIEDWLERVGLGDWKKHRVEQLSKGMSQKVQVLATLISGPDLVLLDEPFSGLDPVNAVVLRDLVIEQQKRGTTIVFSTHDMAVAERLCDSIVMLHRGRKVLDGPTERVLAEHASDVVRVELTDGQAASLDNLPGVRHVERRGRDVELHLDTGAPTRPLMSALADRVEVTRFERARPTLHDIFVDIATDAPESEGADDA